MSLSRREYILKLIVEDFIENAEPIGSNTLITKYGLDMSSATARNEMMELEKLGFLEKPHTSAGRVPSSKGYRYYVEHLSKEDEVEVDESFKKEFQLVLNKKSQSIEEVMEQSCQILSEMTNLATVVLGPTANDEHLVSIQIVPISKQAATAIFVTDRGYVENKTFLLQEGQTSKDVIACVDVLNKRLVGTSILDVCPKLESLKPILLEKLGQSTSVLIDAFTETFVKFAKERISTYGAKRLLDIPEYDEDKKKLQNVIELLDDPDKFYEAVQGMTSLTDDINYIQDDDKDLTILSHSFGGDNRIAIVGPQRMDYKKILSTLEYIADELSKYFGDSFIGMNSDEDEDEEN